MVVDESPEGLEVLRGSSSYIYEGNWKLQAENGADGYHVCAIHWNYAATQARRTSGESKNDTKTDGRGRLVQAEGRLLLLRPRPPARSWTKWLTPPTGRCSRVRIQKECG